LAVGAGFRGMLWQVVRVRRRGVCWVPRRRSFLAGFLPGRICRVKVGEPPTRVCWGLST
jgi:hypothetical protein